MLVEEKVLGTDKQIGLDPDQQLTSLVARLREQDDAREQVAKAMDTFLTEFDAELSNALDQAFDRRAAAIDWLMTPTTAMRARPVELLKSGSRHLVLAELNRIAHGDFA